MMTLEANKALIRQVFEKVIPAGDSAAMRDLVAPEWIDHDPLPGQPAGLEGAEYVVSTMHGAHPDLRFDIDDLIAEGDRVTIRWTLHGTNTGPLFGRPRPASGSNWPPSSSSGSRTGESRSGGRLEARPGPVR